MANRNEKPLDHHQKVARVKFFVEMQIAFSDLFHRLRTSIYTDREQQPELFKSMETILLFVDSNIIHKETEVRIELLEFHFDPNCAECGHRNNPIEPIDALEWVRKGSPKCEKCNNSLYYKEQVSIRR